MTQLFAAVDASGQIQFVGDVPRGAACGCFCPVCSSPLVAKQGGVKEWHFAHEGQQERVECAAGAANMMRRIAYETLKDRTNWQPPPISIRVRSRNLHEAVTELVSFNKSVNLPWEWLPPAAKHDPVAHSRLTDGSPVQLFIDVSQERSTPINPMQDGDAAMVFWVYMPEMDTLRHLDSACRFVESSGVLFWRNLPDTDGRLKAAQARVDKAARERELAVKAKWAAMQQAFDADRPSEQPIRPVSQWNAPTLAKPPSAPKAFDGAPGQIPGTMINFYRLKDGSAWILYKREGGGMALAPWGKADEGWDEALPPSVGSADQELGAYLVTNLIGAFTYLGANAQLTRNDTNPDAFNGL